MQISAFREKQTPPPAPHPPHTLWSLETAAVRSDKWRPGPLPLSDAACRSAPGATRRRSRAQLEPRLTATAGSPGTRCGAKGIFGDGSEAGRLGVTRPGTARSVGLGFASDLYHFGTCPSCFGNNKKCVAVFCSQLANSLGHLILWQKQEEKRQK